MLLPSLFRTRLFRTRLFRTRALLKTSLLLLSSSAVVTPALSEVYTIDAEHSAVGFKVKHLAISSVPGQFKTFSGDIQFDPTKPEKSSVVATIDAGSVTTQQTKRDEHLRSEDFFDIKKFPTLTFKSSGIEGASKDAFKVKGDLTMHGVTKPVVLDVAYNGASKDPGGNERVAFSATTELNRKDFGLAWNKLLETGALVVGENVKISLEIEAMKKK
jgi:polyisoprenoid-binding protein YceI